MAGARTRGGSVERRMVGRSVRVIWPHAPRRRMRGAGAKPLYALLTFARVLTRYADAPCRSCRCAPELARPCLATGRTCAGYVLGHLGAPISRRPDKSVAEDEDHASYARAGRLARVQPRVARL